jgi:glycosyltransferase involved in cell wall biosynthesis
MPEVSLIITTYNEEKYIAGAIESAWKQTLERDRYEIVVVDDGGVDNTDKIVQDLKSKGLNFRYLKKKNGGTASARNFGVANSTGEYISFLDGDDKYAPKKLKLSLDYMNKGENIGVVYSDYIEQYPERDQLRLKQNFNPDSLFKTCIISTNSMIRRSAFDKVGGFDETFKYVEDYDFWCRVIMSGYFALRVPEPLFFYNCRRDSKTNSTKIEKIQPEWDRIAKRIHDNEWRIKK